MTTASSWQKTPSSSTTRSPKASAPTTTPLLRIQSHPFFVCSTPTLSCLSIPFRLCWLLLEAAKRLCPPAVMNSAGSPEEAPDVSPTLRQLATKLLEAVPSIHGQRHSARAEKYFRPLQCLMVVEPVPRKMFF